MKEEPSLLELYHRLSGSYGYQGWWPLTARAGTAGYDPEGYRVSPRTPRSLSRDDLFEIGAGAILTQNTAWENARRALDALRERGLLVVEALRRAPPGELAESIRSCGYYNQKARKLMGWARFVEKIDRGRQADRRSALLGLWGVGPETADSILLYGFGEPWFVVDTYAKRIFARVGIVEERASYPALQNLCHRSLPADVELLGEYHALLVRHGRRFCLKAPKCERCPLRPVCSYGRGEEPPAHKR